jgi:hypothetical protein
MSGLKKHVLADIFLFFAASVLLVVFYLKGESYALLGVAVFAPMAFSIHFLLLLITGLIKWNREYLVYSFFGLLICALMLGIVFRAIS